MTPSASRRAIQPRIAKHDPVVGVPLWDAVDLFLRQSLPSMSNSSKLIGGVLDAASSALIARDIKVKQGDVRDAKAVQSRQR
ncbi:MAG: hypothetical protein R3E92_03165 [Burkholderiaceae bacterium]